VASRSLHSILDEIRALASDEEFRGTLTDLGVDRQHVADRVRPSEIHRLCRRSSCLFPSPCRHLHVDHGPLIELYRQARRVPGVRHVFVASGIRHDLAHADRRNGEAYLRELVTHHVSGHLKVAPEHVSESVLRVMRKPPLQEFDRFRAEFERFSREAGKEQYLVPYFISSHPGCTLKDAAELHDYLRKHNWKPQQVQDFMPPHDPGHRYVL